MNMCKDKESETSESAYIMTQVLEIDAKNDRYPYCIVWTPIPLLTHLAVHGGSQDILSQAKVTYAVLFVPSDEGQTSPWTHPQHIADTEHCDKSDNQPPHVHRWLFPFIGHMGICTSSGVIRDFAGSYYVSEDNMGFGRPTKYWQLSSSSVQGGATAWDRAVADAADIYKTRMHNLCCDNCHSMVALALNNMKYDGKTSWNMVNVAIPTLVYGRYVSFSAWLKTWLPFVLIAVIIAIFITLQNGVL